MKAFPPLLMAIYWHFIQCIIFLHKNMIHLQFESPGS